MTFRDPKGRNLAGGSLHFLEQTLHRTCTNVRASVVPSCVQIGVTLKPTGTNEFYRFRQTPAGIGPALAPTQALRGSRATAVSPIKAATRESCSVAVMKRKWLIRFIPESDRPCVAESDESAAGFGM